MHECPHEECDETFGTRNGVVMHYLNKPTHTSLQTKHEVYAALNGDEEARDTSRQDSRGSPVDSETDSEPSDGPQRLELPTRDSDTAESPSEPADDGVACPECGSERASTVGEETETLREQGFDPTAVPQDAYVCYDCWIDGNVSVYK